ncbi:carboxylesterase, putative [Metarhizium acridum CQMa 102]|uniref:Carboxylesterase, putative n=1 Tax=Metarhizium acridum (strain CQMa 102) TaxID=655827 RepID=E9DWY2_METAQ|nr:carboxylesterase, putative [Metarhizium acridum CQMa 102]EFY91845.1 carboxylesterase, putative [Metarhizium acridum CQMa 102]
MGLVLLHSKLNAQFHGVKDSRYGESVEHFRGIQYGSISHRFATPHPVADFGGQAVDATRFGLSPRASPLCPQVVLDTGYLLRLPGESDDADLSYDEFSCLNLNVHRPSHASTYGKLLPVLIWIHGGSQVMTFTPASSRVCDPTRIVAQSISSKNPIIVITVNYRLNVFAFGDWNCMKNLALRDQRLAIEWVVRNIDEFNGDPGEQGKLTLAGESAGAVYVHAHTFLDAPVQSAILASGSLFLSPPAATETANHMVKRLSEAAWKIAKVSLRDAPVAVLIQALSDCNITSMFLQSEPGLEDWKTRDENVSRLMIGDVEYESILWREGIEMMAADDIVGCFSQEHHHGAKLMELYRINPSRPTQTKIGALDFINDVCFALPVEMIAQRWKARKGEVYRYFLRQFLRECGCRFSAELDRLCEWTVALADSD